MPRIARKNRNGQPRARDPIRRALGETEPSPGESSKEAATGLRKPGQPTAPPDLVNRNGGRTVTGWLRSLGPGLITGASDDDPSGIGTYAQVGSQFGYGMLWTALFTTPLMLAVQELCARIALTTGVGLGVSLRRKFPRWLVGSAILALIVANTINVGADLGAVAIGGSLLSRGHVPALWLVVPAAALILALELFSTYRLIFRTFKWLTVALFAYVVTAFFAHPDLLRLAGATFIPQIQVSPGYLTGLVAVFGTTISPYLFFWQASSEVDEMSAAGLRTEAARRGSTRQEMRSARVDVFSGMFFSQAVMYFIILTSAAVLNAHGRTHIETAGEAASALAPLAGQFAFILFAAGLIGAGLLAIPILTGSAAYAVKEFVGLPGDLAAKPRFRPTFYALIVVSTLVGVTFNFLHVNPITALFLAAVVNGLIAPPLIVLIVLLGSDKKVMGEQVSGRLSRLLTWATAIAMSLAALGLTASAVLSR